MPMASILLNDCVMIPSFRPRAPRGVLISKKDSSQLQPCWISLAYAVLYK